MCSCKAHHNPNAVCTCNCDGHRGYLKAWSNERGVEAMEPEVQEEAEVPRGNVDSTVSIRRAGRGVVVSVVPAKTRRYELWSVDGEGNRWLEAALDVSEDR